MEAIKVQNLVKKYKKSVTSAVDDISFNVKEGEFFAFLGPNGAGKTTTISILTTTLAASSGQVSIAGYDLQTEARKIRQHVGIIFQNPSLDLNLTAEENIRFHAVLYGLFPFRPSFNMMPKAYRTRVQELAELVGIEKEIRRPVKTFSGGMKRKLEIVRSLMHDPRILFLDEPTTGLDPLSRKNLWEYLQTVKANQNTTIFLTTHYLEEAEGADHVVILNNGKVVSDGSPAQIKQDLVDEYLILQSPDNLKLVKELETKGYSPSVDAERIRLEISSGSEVQKLISSLDTELSLIDMHKPSLEEAYLEAIATTSNQEETT